MRLGPVVCARASRGYMGAALDTPRASRLAVLLRGPRAIKGLPGA